MYNGGHMRLTITKLMFPCTKRVGAGNRTTSNALLSKGLDVMRH